MAKVPESTAKIKVDNSQFLKGLREIRAELKSLQSFAKSQGTLQLTAKLAGASTSAIRKQISDATSGSPVSVKIKFDAAQVKPELDRLKTQLTSVTSINTATLQALQVVLNDQITKLNALATQLRSLGAGGSGGGRGGAGGGQSGATSALLNELKALSNQYKRGELDAASYAVKLSELQGRIRTAAGSAAAGSADFRALDGALTSTTQRLAAGIRNVNTNSITKLKTELSGAKAEFERAAAAATTLAQRQAAAAGYAAEVNRIKGALTGLATSGTLTAQQLASVNAQLAGLERESRALNSGRFRGLQLEAGNALQQLLQFVPGAGAVTGSLGSMNGALAAVTVTVGLFAAGLSASFKTAAQFQQTMADIRALTQPTAADFDKLRAATFNIGQPLGVGARDAAAAILELNKAGLSAKEVIGGGLKGALELAGAAGITAAEGSRLAVAAMTAFKLSADKLPRVADVFANFANQTVLGAEDLSQAIASVGPVAVNAGLSLEQFAGLAATLAQGGFKQMSDAGTSLKTMLLSLQAPTTDAAAVLAQYGINAYDAAGNFLPLEKTLEQLRGKLNDLSDEKRNKALKAIFGSDGIRAATILIGKSAADIDALTAALGKQGEAARVAQERLNTYNGSVAKASANVEELKISIGEKLLPAATALVDGFNGLIDGVQYFGENTSALIGFIAPVIVAFVAFRAAAIAAAAPAVWAALTTQIVAFFGVLQTQLAAMSAFAAANPFGVIAIAAAALAVVVNAQITALSQATQKAAEDAIASQNETIDRMRQIRSEGGAAAKEQLAFLKALEAQRAAENGQVVGTDFFGGLVIKGSTKAEIEAARAEVEKTRKALVDAKKAAEAAGQPVGTLGGPGLSPERLQEQQKALAALRNSLRDREFSLKLSGKEGLERDLAQLQNEFDKLRIKAKEAFGGNLNNSELRAALKQLDDQLAAEQAAARERDRQERAKKAAETLKQGVEAAKAAERAARQAQIDAMAEGAAKVSATRQLELDDLRANANKQLELYKSNATVVAQLRAGLRANEQALADKWAREDEQKARETAAKVLAAQLDAQDKTREAEAAARASQLALFEEQQAARLAQVKGDAVKEAQIRAESVRVTAAFEAASSRAQLEKEKSDLQRKLGEALAAEGLSATERAQIMRGYYADVNAADSEFRSREAKRRADAKQKEIDALEAIRAARAKTALQGTDETKKQTEQLRSQQSLTESVSERLDYERQIEASQRRYAAELQNVLDTQKLSDDERKDVTERIAAAQNAVLTSQKAQVTLSRDLTALGRELVESFKQFSSAVSASDPAAKAQRELALQTKEVGDSYERVLPLLREYQRNQDPSKLEGLRDGVKALVENLSEQKAALEDLRSEYERQDSALKSLTGTLEDFKTTLAKDAGGTVDNNAALKRLVDTNAQALIDAQEALRVLTSSGKASAEELDKATKKLSTSYGSLKSSINDLADSQAKAFDDQAKAEKKASEARIKQIEAEIKARKAAGLDTTQLEQQKADQESRTQAKVDALAAQAEDIRNKAEADLKSRTTGIAALLEDVGVAAAKSETEIQSLKGQVEEAERKVKDSAATMKSALAGAFTSLPDLALKAGRDAGAQFVSGLQGALKTSKLPAVQVTGPTNRSAAGVGGTVNNVTLNLSVNGQNVSGTTNPNLRNLLTQLAREAERECREGNLRG